MSRLALLVLISTFSMSVAYASENFDDLKCEDDIAASLVGRKMGNLTVSDLETKYSALHLEDMGADGPEKGVTFVVWKICGDFYMVLEKAQVITAAVKSTGSDPQPTLAKCKGRKGEVVAVFERPALTPKPLVKRAWKINYKKATFVTLDEKALSCKKL